jgi:uncharacterized protein YcbX
MKVTEINIYPIKSTRRIALHASAVLPRGLPWDRRWMLVDENNNFITARQHPALAMVQTEIDGDSLVIVAEAGGVLRLPLHPEQRQTARVTLWRDSVDAVVTNPEADAWFADFLGISCRLVQMTDDLTRGVDQEYGQPDDEVSFADGFPLLLITEASLADLNSRLDNPVDMRRFRPNLVVDGDVPYAEDGWRRFRVGEVEFAGVKNCSRCVFTTVDPDRGIKSPDQEPLRTLSTYRRRQEGGVFFGQNLIPRGFGVIRVGDRLTLLD